MADVNFNMPKQWTDAAQAAGMDDASGSLEYELIELLFFAYRDFISDPDEILAEYGFGRAHHRVLHFVSRNPGIRVTELLDILKITKQSLGRVLKQLIDEDFIEQRTGPLDRRQRLLYATDKGRALSERLAAPQSRRLARALAELPEGGHEIARQFLYRIIDENERARVAHLANKR
ncbi:MarR family transcriptional regulator [Breoghania sp. L-A4]|uniref:MarR family winged helix-turn-helix transcriptional regulator n=1 Tax=Breoghania sp. L-A4 TaxID=2304600 RepID=UPI000E35DF9A|nr:MarR family transcriptional regulator [Breoghania sp. L-A4]AXS41442.1 MarR family transcriptional regulator [Breoghania sp. L-A4]